MARNPNKQKVAVEISDDFVKVVEVSAPKNKKSPPSVSLSSRKLFSKDSGAKEAAFREIFDELKLQAKNVSVNIPRHHVMVRFFTVPSSKDEEIKNIVKMESARQSPYGPDESITSYRVIQKKKDGYSDILMAIAQKAFIEEQMAVIGSLGTDITHLSLGTESLCSWFMAAGRTLNKNDDKEVALVNVDAKHVNIALLSQGHLVYSRAVAHRAEGIVGSKIAADDIVKTLNAYQKEKTVTLNRIFMTGYKDRIEEIEGMVREETSIPLEHLDQCSGFSAETGAVDHTKIVSFVELVGAAVSGGAGNVNLLPEDIKKEHEISFIKYNLTKTILLLVAITLVIFATTIKGLMYRNQMIKRLDTELTKMKPKVSELKKMKEAMVIVKSEVQKKPQAVEVLAEITNSTPAGMSFSSMDYESGKAITLKGQADSMDTILRLVSTLESSEMFDNVKVKYTSKKERGQSHGTEFEITGGMAKPKV